MVQNDRLHRQHGHTMLGFRQGQASQWDAFEPSGRETLCLGLQFLVNEQRTLVTGDQCDPPRVRAQANGRLQRAPGVNVDRYPGKIRLPGQTPGGLFVEAGEDNRHLRPQCGPDFKHVVERIGVQGYDGRKLAPAILRVQLGCEGLSVTRLVVEVGIQMFRTQFILAARISCQGLPQPR